MSYYILIHRREIDASKGDIKYLGIFDDFNKVQPVINKLIKYPGFSKYPQILTQDSFDVEQTGYSGFMIKKFMTNKDYLDQTLNDS